MEICFCAAVGRGLETPSELEGRRHTPQVARTIKTQNSDCPRFSEH